MGLLRGICSGREAEGEQRAALLLPDEMRCEVLTGQTQTRADGWLLPLTACQGWLASRAAASGVMQSSLWQACQNKLVCRRQIQPRRLDWEFASTCGALTLNMFPQSGKLVARLMTGMTSDII